MKANDHFVLRSIYGQHLLFPVSKNTVGNELISLNEVGADIWKCASKGLSEQEIISNIGEIYSLESGSAEERAVEAFIKALCEKGLLYRTEED